MRAWEAPGLHLGLAVGAVAASTLVLALWTARRRWCGPHPAPVVGVVFAAGGLALVATERVVPVGVVAGAALVGLGAAASRRTGLARHLGVLFALGGGAAVAFDGGIVEDAWVRALVVVAAGAALAVARADEVTARAAPGPVLFAITCGGAFLAVPDTEEVSLLVGLAVPLALVGWPLGLARLGRIGGAVATMVLTWTIAIGGVGRTASIVGAVLGLGLLVTIPFGSVVRDRFGRRWFAPQPWGAPALLVAHLGVVMPLSRVAGHADSVGRAVVFALVPVVVAAGAGMRAVGPASP